MREPEEEPPPGASTSPPPQLPLELKRQRRSVRAPPAPPPPTTRTTLLRQVSNILKKSESCRSSEELAVLADMKDVVDEVNFRIRRRRETLDRNKEIEDEPRVLLAKCRKLAAAIADAEHLVVYTGAGISTAADIPDYRGPNGIWTLLQQGKKIGKHDLTRANPTLTHMALWKLYQQRYLRFVVSQNCDGLHLRSGLPRRALSEVHGNMYVEICKSCKPNVQYWRSFDTTERTARYNHRTGRLCHVCGCSLEDSIVHFGERGVAQWPLNWSGALFHAAKADVILCLGSSLKVLKKYPWLWAMNKPIKKRPAIFIVNLQWTPKDDVAALKINGKCDNVMELVMEYLGLETPKYNRLSDPIFAHSSRLCPKEFHTTTQPMLIKVVQETEKIDSTQDKNVEAEDSDDDCPLNLLKMKISHLDNRPIDLSVKKNVHNTTDDDCSSKDDLRVNLCTLEKKKIDFKLKTDGVCENTVSNYINDSNVNIKANSDKSNGFKYKNNLEPFLSDNNVENFEKVYIEMQTSNAEICNVCILLVKNRSSFNKYRYFNHNINSARSISDYSKRSDVEVLDADLSDYENIQNNAIDNKKVETEVLSKLSLPSISNGFGNFQKEENNLQKYAFKSLRNFRKIKEYQSAFLENEFSCNEKHKLNIPSSAHCITINLNKSDKHIVESLKPLDFSLRFKSQMSFAKKKYEIYNPHSSNKVFTMPNYVPKRSDTNFCNVAIDLSFSTNLLMKINNNSDFVNQDLHRKSNLSTTKNSPFTVFKRCEYFAKIIIRNTILVNRKELQYAYSGLHSIIDPIPFYTEYDFTGVFNSFNFIRFAQNLLSKGKNIDIHRVRNSNFKSERMKKRKFGFKNRTRSQKKEPLCLFCHEQYKTYTCNFYKPFNSESRFEKWHKGKLIMCDCCVDTDTSNSDIESSDSGSGSASGGEDDKNSILNSDLKNCVQISIKNSCNDDAESDNVQAGWFGKGFRKNRRRKR